MQVYKVYKDLNSNHIMLLHEIVVGKVQVYSLFVSFGEWTHCNLNSMMHNKQWGWLAWTTTDILLLNTGRSRV